MSPAVLAEQMARSSLGLFIGMIISLGSQEKVVGIYTPRVVAFVQDLLAFRNWSVHQLVRNYVGATGGPIPVEIAVSATASCNCSRPQPAFLWKLVYLVPKALFNRNAVPWHDSIMPEVV